MKLGFTSRVLLVTGLALAASAWLVSWTPASSQGEENIDSQIRETCSKCHRFPPPEIMAKHEWTEKVNTMFHLANRELLGSYGRPIWELDPTEVSRYFVARAPEELPIVPMGDGQEIRPISFQRSSISGGQTLIDKPGGANVQLYELFEDNPGPELVICDMLSGWVTWADPRRPDSGVHPVGRVRNPCHSEMVDLDEDGFRDLLVADLGDPLPSDSQLGAVYLFRGLPDRQFEAIPIIESLGRVADARAADFDRDGDLDLIVAEFGWRRLGSIRFLENVSEEPADLRFVSKVIDERNGSIHLPILDLNDDGHLDFVALLSQEHEVILAFLGDGAGSFQPEEIFTGPHPHWGSSGIQMVDLDGDGDQDVLYTNGDTLDDLKLRPYHGLQWLENPGTGEFPFVRHAIDFYYGIHRAEAGDIDGDGDLDIAVSSFLPEMLETNAEALRLRGVAWYEQVEKGIFVKRLIDDVSCDFPTLDLGDMDGDGLLDVIVGNLLTGEPGSRQTPPLVQIWRQQPR